MSTARSTQYISYNSLVIRVKQQQQQQTHKYVVFAALPHVSLHALCGGGNCGVVVFAPGDLCASRVLSTNALCTQRCTFRTNQRGDVLTNYLSEKYEMCPSPATTTTTTTNITRTAAVVEPKSSTCVYTHAFAKRQAAHCNNNNYTRGSSSCAQHRGGLR